jgi:O-antigen/teichoic acid export membrane protein
MADSSGSAPYLESVQRFLRDRLNLRLLRNFLGSDRASLRARILSAGAWMLGAHGAEMAIRFVFSLIVTRILFPEAFGLMAFVGAILLGLNLVSDLGIHFIIIRDEEGEDEGFLRSAWTVQLVRGLGLWLVFIAIALALLVADKGGLLPSGSTVADPMLPALLPVVGLNAVLMGCASVNQHLLVRRLTFKPLVLLDIGSRLISLPVILVWASFDRSVWALVAGQLASGISRTIASHIVLQGPRMALRWNQDHVRKLLHSGKWVAISSTAQFLTTQGDRLLLGAFLSSTTLGLYSVAWFLKDACESVLQRYHSNMTLPILGETLREQPHAFRERFYRYRAPFEAAAFFSGGALIVSGGKIVELLYDPRYLEAGWMLQILAISLIAFPMHMVGTGLLATGEMSRVALISIINAVSLIILICIGYWIAGLPGAIAGVALGRMPANVVVMVLAHNRDWINLSAEFRYAPLVGVGMIAGLTGIWLMRGLGFIS